MSSDPTTSDPGATGPTTDDALLAALRRVWERADPAPAGLDEDAIVAVAGADLAVEYALLTRVDSDAHAAVRADADLLTMQFTDGRTSVLVHVTAAERGARRVDGWVDGDVAEVHLLHEDEARHAASEGPRFSFDAVPTGIARLRVVLSTPPHPGAPMQLLTPRFEI